MYHRNEEEETRKPIAWQLSHMFSKQEILGQLYGIDLHLLDESVICAWDSKLFHSGPENFLILIISSKTDLAAFM